MPRPLPVRGLTDLTRRKAKRDATDYAHNMALSHRMVGLRDSIQRGMVMTFMDAEAAYDMIVPLVALIMILVHNGHNEQATAAVTMMLEIEVREYQSNTNLF